MAGITQDAAAPDRDAVAGIAAAAEPFPTIGDADLSGFLDRVGDARVVLLGECSHGTSEFYRLRARITRALVEEKGFRIVGLEADWPDAAAFDHYVRDLPGDPPPEPPFRRFPTWMWANRELLELVHALRRVNERRPSPDPSAAVGVYGLDLYSLYASIAAVLQYLDDVDPEAAAVARERYACLSPWEGDPVAARNLPGGGAELAIELPVRAAPERPAAPAPPAPEPARPRRILVVDDNLDSADALSALLGLRGHTVVTVASGPSALEAAEELRPEAAILDIGLPEMDGFKVARRLRERFGPDLVLVALTGYGREQDRARGLEAGFDHYLLKPVSSEALERLLSGEDLGSEEPGETAAE